MLKLEGHPLLVAAATFLFDNLAEPKFIWNYDPKWYGKLHEWYHSGPAVLEGAVVGGGMATLNILSKKDTFLAHIAPFLISFPISLGLNEFIHRIWDNEIWRTQPYEEYKKYLIPLATALTTLLTILIFDHLEKPLSKLI